MLKICQAHECMGSRPYRSIESILEAARLEIKKGYKEWPLWATGTSSILQGGEAIPLFVYLQNINSG